MTIKIKEEFLLGLICFSLCAFSPAALAAMTPQQVQGQTADKEHSGSAGAVAAQPGQAPAPDTAHAGSTGAVPVPPAQTPPALPGGFGLSLGPSIVRIAGKPGETQQASVRVSNQSKHPIELIVEVYDLGNRLTPAGELERVFPAAGTLPHSCASAIQLPANQITVEPGGFKDVQLLVAIPPDLSGGRSAVVFFRGVPSASDEGAKTANANKPTATVQIQPRIGVLVFVEALGTVKRTGKIENFKVTPPADGEPLRMDYVFENTGNVDVLLAGTFYMLSANNALAAKGSINSVRTFPGDRGSSKTIWEGALDPGRYHLVASFELGPDSQEVVVQEADVVVA